MGERERETERPRGKARGGGRNVRKSRGEVERRDLRRCTKI